MSTPSGNNQLRNNFWSLRSRDLARATILRRGLAIRKSQDFMLQYCLGLSLVGLVRNVSKSLSGDVGEVKCE